MGSPRSGTYRYPDDVVIRVRDLRELENLTVREIAERTGASRSWIRHVIYYRRRHLPNPEAVRGPVLQQQSNP